MARVLLGVLIGVGGTLAWQSHGEEAKRIVRPWVPEIVMSHAPSVAWVLSSWTKSRQSDAQGHTAREENAGTPPSLPVIHPTSPPPQNGNDPGVARQLAAMEGDLNILRRSVEQLAEKQRQLLQSVATQQAELGQKLATLQTELGQKLATVPADIGHKSSAPPDPPAAATPVEQSAIVAPRPRPRAAPARRAPSPFWD